ncbi:MAG: sensor domain-containing diguanylate cyclase [Lachnospiraceae bacterium]|nr:sensor domain-containing diguanylate cyclase [Lachnospiraceae bacterium]
MGFIKKHTILITNIIVFGLIFAAIILLQYNDARYYKKTVENQVINDIERACFDIDTQLSKVTTEERVVSQMMANDVFLKEWAADETKNSMSSYDWQKLYDYLKAYRLKYDYDVVFFVSDNTGNYYYQDGLNKTVSPENEFDSWYYNFLALDQEYDIQIDRDEVNDYQVSIFVNCRVTDDNGNVIGVAGVGNLLDEFQHEIKKNCGLLGVNVFIVNTRNAHNSYKGSTDYFRKSDEVAKKLGIDEKAITSSDIPPEGKQITSGDKCIIIRQNPDLHWNIVVEKDMKSLVQVLLTRAAINMGFVMLIVVPLLVLAMALLYGLSHRIVDMQNTDELTGLMNQRLFRKKYYKAIRKNRKRAGTLVMFDVDDFKSFNDTKGHLYGNMVLSVTADKLKEAVGQDGMACRWGGDEFMALIYETSDKALLRMNEMNRRVYDESEKEMRISLSIGAADIDPKKSLDEMIAMADTALYYAKGHGKNQCAVYTDEMSR